MFRGSPLSYIYDRSKAKVLDIILPLMYWSRISIGLAALSAVRAAHTVVQGNHVSWLGVRNETTAFDYFLGVPFARPPVGPLRFKPPVPLVTPTSATTVNATVAGNACEQGKISDPAIPISEDCLFLNICMHAR